MIGLVLEDSQLTPCKARDINDDQGKKLGLIEKAITTLNSEVAEGRITCCAFFGKRREAVIPELVRAYPQKVISRYNGRIISELFFTTSHYVGQACIRIEDETVKIRIGPRFARPIWNHLLQCASRVYIPERFSSSGLSLNNETEWLLLLMWRNAFDRALRNASVPKAYIQKRKNLRFFRGRLDVSRHLIANLADQSRMFCAYSPLCFDNTINRTIRSVYRVLASVSMSSKVCASISEHDNRLATLGVSNVGVTLQDISAIKYTRMNEAYRPVMELSKVILRGYGAGEFGGEGSGPSYFVDVAEIWENYLLMVMRRYLPEYTFVSPNDNNDESWLLRTARPVRPDFLVYDCHHHLIAVMDAKYKRYGRIGRYGTEPHSVSREDLYQMATYMSHFGPHNLPFAGIFISPFNTENEGMLELTGSPQHFMSICNLPLETLCDTPTEKDNVKESLAAIEREFATRLDDRLKQIVVLQNAKGSP